MLSIFKKKKKNIFIHIPKTGGSTFVGLLKKSLKTDRANLIAPTHKTEKVGNVEISHIDFNSPLRTFKKKEIFEEGSAKQFENCQLFMLVRNPIDRLTSEFNFQFHILDGKNGNPSAGILARLPKRPKRINEYLTFPHVQDYQLKFLLGRKLADPNPVTEEEYQRVIEKIISLPIHCGITKQYEKFLDLFQQISKHKLKREVIIRKSTPTYLKQPLSEKTKNKIVEYNQFDWRLYNFVSQLDYIQEKGKTVHFDFESNDQFVI